MLCPLKPGVKNQPVCQNPLLRTPRCQQTGMRPPPLPLHAKTPWHKMAMFIPRQHFFHIATFASVLSWPWRRKSRSAGGHPAPRLISQEEFWQAWDGATAEEKAMMDAALDFGDDVAREKTEKKNAIRVCFRPESNTTGKEGQTSKNLL